MSSFLPSAGTLPAIDDAFQQVRGALASVFGQTYDVYRLSSATSATGIVSPSSQIASVVPAIFKAKPKAIDIEISTSIKYLAFSATVDIRTFLEGDIFVQNTNSYHYESTTYVLVSRRPSPRQSVFIACPAPYATFTRPESNPQHIDSGRAPQSVAIKEREWPLTLSGGYYSFQQTGTPVSVPVGYSFSRSREYPRSDTSLGALWDDTPRSVWDLFVPLLKGQPLIPRDIVQGGNGDRYEILSVQPVSAAIYGQFVQIRRIRS